MRKEQWVAVEEKEVKWQERLKGMWFSKNQTIVEYILYGGKEEKCNRSHRVQQLTTANGLRNLSVERE